MMRKSRILSVFWHSVESDSMPAEFLDGTNPSASAFREQIGFLVRNYTPISVWDFLRRIEKEDLIPSYAKPPVLLGFDDGFKNVIANALPILIEFNVPAVFFVMGGILGDPDFLPWFVEVKHLLRRTKHRRVVYRGVNLDLTCRRDVAQARRLIEAAYKGCSSEAERQHLLTHLASLMGVERPAVAELDDDLRLLNRKDLAQLDTSSLLTIGSHGFTHRHLASLGYDEQLFELRQSDTVLREHSGSYCPVVAYPGGSFNATTIAIAREVYRAGFAVFHGASYGNHYAYPREGLTQCTIRRLEYVLNPVRLNFLLPLKKWLQRAGLRKVEG